MTTCLCTINRSMNTCRYNHDCKKYPCLMYLNRLCWDMSSDHTHLRKQCIFEGLDPYLIKDLSNLVISYDNPVNITQIKRIPLIDISPTDNYKYTYGEARELYPDFKFNQKDIDIYNSFDHKEFKCDLLLQITFDNDEYGYDPYRSEDLCKTPKYIRKVKFTDGKDSKNFRVKYKTISNHDYKTYIEGADYVICRTGHIDHIISNLYVIDQHNDYNLYLAVSDVTTDPYDSDDSDNEYVPLLVVYSEEGCNIWRDICDISRHTNIYMGGIIVTKKFSDLKFIQDETEYAEYDWNNIANIFSINYNGKNYLYVSFFARHSDYDEHSYYDIVGHIYTDDIDTKLFNYKD